MIKLRKRKSVFALFVIVCLMVATVLPSVALADRGGNPGHGSGHGHGQGQGHESGEGQGHGHGGEGQGHGGEGQGHGGEGQGHGHGHEPGQGQGQGPGEGGEQDQGSDEGKGKGKGQGQDQGSGEDEGKGKGQGQGETLNKFNNIKTTDASGEVVNENHYEDIDDVWVAGYGGTPNSEYKIWLRVSFTNSGPLATGSTNITTDASGYFHINLVDIVGEFEVDRQKGYKVEMSTSGLFSGSASKSDNFKLKKGQNPQEPGDDQDELTIVKELLDSEGNVIDSEITFNIQVTGPDYTYTGTITSNDETPLVLTDLAKGEYSVVELEGNGYDLEDYTVSYSSAKIQLGQKCGTKTITVTNTEKANSGGGGQDPVNRPPVANDDAYTTTENTQLSVPAPGVLSNDTDADSDTLTVNSNSIPINGDLVLQDDGSFVYQPDAGFTGTDSFTYTISDGKTTSNYATVTITVTGDNSGGGGQDPVNRPPIAQNDNYSTKENKDLVILPNGILGNDTDADGDEITVDTATVSNPLHGTLIVNADGSFTYEPDRGWHGTDSFVYRIWDGEEYSDFALVTIKVERKNSDGGNNGGNNDNDNDNDKEDNDGDDNEPVVVPGDTTPQGPGSDSKPIQPGASQPEGVEIPVDEDVAAPATPQDPAVPGNQLPKTGAYPAAAAALGTMLLGLGVYLRKR